MKKINKIISLVLLLGVIIQPFSVLALSKEEMIYSMLSYDGSLHNTIVTNHLFVKNSEESINDETELKNILNLNGKETYDLDGNKITWKNLGNDIFYRGTTDKKVPVTTTIKYYLDDKEMSAEDIVGKKGNVKIVLSFKNNLMNKVRVNGRIENLYTPFVMTIGTMLNNKTNSNISISNGKTVNTGNKSMVLALATPGLYDSLGIEQFKNMDEVIINFDTTKFALNNMYIVATPKLITNTDLDVFKKVDSLYGNVRKIQTNMNSIEAGAKELEKGSLALSGGVTTLNDNLKPLLAGIKQLSVGAISLNNGLNQVVSNLELTKSLFTTEKIEQLKLLKATNEGTIKNLQDANTKLNTTYNNPALALESKSYSDIINMCSSYSTSFGFEDSDTCTNSLITAKVEYENNYDNNIKLIELLQNENQVIDNTLLFGEKIDLLLTSLKQIESGSSVLLDGINQLEIGITKISAGTNELNTGAKDLYNGLNEYTIGVSTFNNEGIKKLSLLANTMKGYSNKVEALINLSKKYNGFASNNSDNTTFVYVIKSVK